MELALVVLILVVAVILFVTERVPVDVVALLVLVALLALGLVTPTEGVSGFGNPATMTVAAMFVLSAGLQRTGAVSVLGRLLTRYGRYEWSLLFLVMAPIGFISAFINNTAAVAVFMPFVLAAAAARKVAPSRLLIPLSFASQFGGVCTLIGTSTNLLVSSIAERAGLGPFAMFEFSQLGLIMLGAGVAYFLFLGRWLLPRRRGGELTERYQLGEFIAELRVMKGSPLVGKSLQKSRLGETHDVTVLGILRDQEQFWAPTTEALRPADILLVRGRVKDLLQLKHTTGLEMAAEFKLKDAVFEREDRVLVEAIVATSSRLIGRTLAEVDFHRRFNAIVLAIQRRGHSLREKLSRLRLELGDVVLLQVRQSEVDHLRANGHLVVLNEIGQSMSRPGRAPWALLIIALVVALAALNVLPIMLSALLGCIAMVLARCLTLEEAYSAIDWRVIVVLGGVLPLGLALEKSGAAQWMAAQAVALVGPLGPVALLATLYGLTMLLTECMSNNAAAVLVAPIAISSALSLGVNPKPFLIAVTFAASTSFATPVGYQTNTMVYNAGAYRFTDFMKVGIPLNLLFWFLAVYFIPILWGF